MFFAGDNHRRKLTRKSQVAFFLYDFLTNSLFSFYGGQNLIKGTAVEMTYCC